MPIPTNAEPQPLPFEAEHDRLAKEVVLLKIQNERLLSKGDRDEYKTTELQQGESEDELETKPIIESPPDQREVFGPLTPKEPINKIPFSTESNDLWVEYNEDVFHQIIWRWHYKPEIDQTPRDIRPFCIECQPLIPLQHHAFKDGGGNPVFTLDCSYHTVQLCELGYLYEFNEKIKELIKQKLNDGSWVDAVNRRRRAKGKPPLSPSLVAPSIPLKPIRD
jgi:hypothetical protein